MGGRRVSRFSLGLGVGGGGDLPVLTDDDKHRSDLNRLPLDPTVSKDCAGIRRGDLDHGLVGLDLDHGLVGLDMPPLGDEPPHDLCLGEALTDVRQEEFPRH